MLDVARKNLRASRSATSSSPRPTPRASAPRRRGRRHRGQHGPARPRPWLDDRRDGPRHTARRLGRDHRRGHTPTSGCAPNTPTSGSASPRPRSKASSATQGSATTATPRSARSEASSPRLRSKSPTSPSSSHGAMFRVTAPWNLGHAAGHVPRMRPCDTCDPGCRHRHGERCGEPGMRTRLLAARCEIGSCALTRELQAECRCGRQPRCGAGRGCGRVGALTLSISAGAVRPLHDPRHR